MATAQSLPRRKAARFRILPESRLERKEALWFWLFISPWAIGFLLFTLAPIVASGYLSLTRYNLSSPPVFIGFDNYVNLFGDRIFWKSMQVTAYYTLLAVPLGIMLSLVLAVLLNQKIPAVGVFRTLFYLPSLLGTSVAVVLLFQWLLNSQFGPLPLWYSLRQGSPIRWTTVSALNIVSYSFRLMTRTTCSGFGCRNACDQLREPS